VTLAPGNAGARITDVSEPKPAAPSTPDRDLGSGALIPARPSIRRNVGQVLGVR